MPVLRDFVTTYIYTYAYIHGYVYPHVHRYMYHIDSNICYAYVAKINTMEHYIHGSSKT